MQQADHRPHETSGQAQLMASAEECEAALASLQARLESVDPDVRRRHALDRSISVEATDLGVTWSARLREGLLHDITQQEPTTKAQLRLTCTSDDLVAVLGGGLSFAQGWASGRLKVEANPLDLLRLRSLF